MKRRAQKLNQAAIDLDEAGFHEEAESKYLEAAAADPKWAVPFFNLGLLTKYQHRWADSLAYNQRALDIEPGKEEALWNAGIAATALEDWQTARSAWRAYGIEIPEGDGPIEMDLGSVVIRVISNSETLWCRRIDPARAVVLNVPLPESGRRYKDLLLHDGAPQGYRRFRGEDVPVFDELQVQRSSDFKTFEHHARVAAPEHVDQLADLALDLEMGAEDWTTIRYVCEACSRGVPHEHPPASALPWQPERRLGLAAKDRASLDLLLERWCSATGAVLLDRS